MEDIFSDEYEDDTGQGEDESNYDSATESEDDEDQQDSDSDAVADSLLETFTSYQPTDEIDEAFEDIVDKGNLSPRGETSYRGGRSSSVKGSLASKDDLS
ncbi:hypothetical protein RND71_042092 [Anisodus tanguticus]|uniref:Uncharacterized protein n=1 Tax=Anisodus tanguticus TaxID=243964 RepID=A0AAE1QQA7_9SOLA|nr:hypothetical protein RND71_042092 [Anisodus tanguticus]